MSPQPSGRDAAAWRRSIGHVLREARRARGQRLTDVAERAGVSPQYLSEVERGRKEPSSEVLAAVTAALDLTLGELAGQLARGLEVVDLASAREARVRAVRGTYARRADVPHARSARPSGGASLLAA